MMQTLPSTVIPHTSRGVSSHIYTSKKEGFKNESWEIHTSTLYRNSELISVSPKVISIHHLKITPRSSSVVHFQNMHVTFVMSRLSRTIQSN